MPTITVKNIPLDLYERLKQVATANRRSLNSEIIVQIERGVRGRKFSPEALLGRARQLRHYTMRHPIADRDFNGAKRAGRA